VFLQTGEIQAVARCDGRAALCELDCYELAQNFGDTLRRHPEHYHRKAQRGQEGNQAGAGIASAHDRVSFKHKITPADLALDDLPRGMFLDRIEGALVEDYAEQPGEEAQCVARFAAGAVSKQYRLAGSRLTAAWGFGGGRPATFSTELNIAMPSCDGPAGRYIVAGRIPGGFGQPLDEQDVRELLLDDEHMGGGIRVTAWPPARIRARPLHTVSQSEDGFEKIMQCATLMLEWRPREQGADPVVELEIYRKGARQ
ncbi:MAG TPA: alpha-amylase/4-alpha-glucanotransferase domain-containing protein, partial [Burkholderiales bacterium]|nr:alpha-amylase/4-alpha-glucanotransferase domain-containing protein [Burkholderiales bacterium]